MDSIVNFLIALGITLVIFLIGREIVCWYFKINKTVALLEEIRDSLRAQSKDNGQ
jgi:hypothetical protein